MASSKRSRRLQSTRSRSQVVEVDLEDEGPSQSRNTGAGSSQRTPIQQMPIEKSLNIFEGYRTGNLVRIEMKNFLTFSSTVVEPGPRLNLIIGPNGTGKSSIVNAVCIVFAGKLNLLGRSADLGGFVRHGASEAAIEVWVYDPSVSLGIRRVSRKFDTDGKGAYMLDGKKCSASVITEFTKEYDIQLDNLSQFMPQEMIAEFVNLKPHELLAITVRSLGGNTQVETFKELIQLDTALKTLAKKLKLREEKLVELRQQNEAATAEVEAYNKQQELKKKMTLMKKMLPYQQAEELRLDYVQVLEERKDLEKQVSDTENKIREIARGRLQELDLKRKTAKENVTAAKQAVTRIEKESTDQITNAEHISYTLNETCNAIRDVDLVAERFQKKVANAEAQVQSYREKIAELARSFPEEEDNRKKKELDHERDSLRQSIHSEEGSKSTFDQTIAHTARNIQHLTQKMNRLQDIREQRINLLERDSRYRGVSQCARLVAELSRQGRFKGRVYGPIVAEISCDTDYHARIMESCVSGFLMGAFVTENASDSRLLIAECKAKLNGWAPDTIAAPTDENDELDIDALRYQRPERPIDDKLRSLGIVGMVSDIFQCADSVRAALNAQALLHNIHVGDSHAEDHSEELRYEDGIQTWYTPSARCAVIKSRYDRNARSLRQEYKFKNCTGRMYSGRMDEVEQEKNHLIRAIREEELNRDNAKQQLNELFSRVSKMKDDLRVVEENLGGIRRRTRDRAKYDIALQRAKETYKHLSTRPGIQEREDRKEELRKKKMELEREAISIVPDIVSGLTLFRDQLAKLDAFSAERVVAERMYATEKEKNAELHNTLQELLEKSEEKKAEAKVAKAEWKKKKRDAERNLSLEEIEANRAECEELMKKDSAWISNEIERLQGRIDGLTTVGQHVLDKYKERLRKIEQLERDIENEKRGHGTEQSHYESKRKSFLTWLQGGVESMRGKFSELYQRLGCAGDLELTNVNSESVGDLELQILVSYREGAELRPISGSSNSGGEKMCCTMLFCFSLLQDEQRMPPFVMVDELNQGLDPVNEMKIMTIMFEDAERGKAPQSFVVTPKLLPDLPFQAASKTHVIFNGEVFSGDISTPVIP